MLKLNRKLKKSLELNKTYSESEYFSQRHRQWKRYSVNKPRLPKNIDINEKWLETLFQPRTLKTFVGKHNNEIIEILTNIRDTFEVSHSFPSQFVVSGPPGSGKSALIRSLIRELNDSCGLDSGNSSKWVLTIDCEKSDITKLWNKIGNFGTSAPDNTIPVAFKIIVLDGADNIPPSAQQILKKVLYNQEGKVKYIFICRDHTKLIGHILARGLTYRTKSMSERDAVALILITLCRESIGYNREGIQEIFNCIKKVQLREIIEGLQTIFTKWHYISAENVQKYFAEKNHTTVKTPVTKQAAIEPLSRCSICTLFPPCKHITIEQLEEQGLKRRSELPRYKKSLVCQQFLTTGHCNIYNKYGRCSLDHPNNLHTIIPSVIRCPQCTLVWPCNHCAYSVARSELDDALTLLHSKLNLLNQIAIPAPPLALTSHLIEEYPNFKEELLQLKRDITLEKEKILRNTVNWFQSTHTIVMEDYLVKLRFIQITFYNVFNSPLLISPKGNSNASIASTIETNEIET